MSIRRIFLAALALLWSGVAYASGIINPAAGGGATTINGTVNQIDVSGIGPYTLSLDPALVAPGSVTIGGTAGAGYLQLTPQSSTTPTPAANTLNIAASPGGAFQIRSSSGFAATFVTSANVASRAYTFPDLAGTVALTANNLGVFATGGAIAPATVNGDTITTGTGTLTLGSATLNAGAGGTLVATAFSTDAANLTGTLNAAQTAALTGDVTKSAGSNATTLANIPAISGANLTALPAGVLTGTVADARLSANVALYNGAGPFTAQQMDQGATGTSPGWYAQITGDTTPRVRVGLNVNDVASIGFGSGSVTRDLFLERAGPATLRLGTSDAAAPVGQTVIVQNVVGGTLNTAGANTVIDLSQGTGTGVGGNLTINCAPHGTTGTVQNALAACVTVTGDTKAVTFAGAISVLSTLTTTGITSLGSLDMTVFSSGTGLTQVWNAGGFAWSSSLSSNGTADTLLCRQAAGVVEVGSGATCAASGSLLLAAATLSGPLTLNASNPFIQGKSTDPGTAPGAAFCKTYWVAGTNANTGKEIAYCGTSTTPVTLVDNVGGGF